jgi:hypothetical protein
LCKRLDRKHGHGRHLARSLGRRARELGLHCVGEARNGDEKGTQCAEKQKCAAHVLHETPLTRSK